MATSTHAAVADARNADIEIYVNGEFFPRAEAISGTYPKKIFSGDTVTDG